MADSSARGRFVWHELMTPNGAGAHEFYKQSSRLENAGVGARRVVRDVCRSERPVGRVDRIARRCAAMDSVRRHERSRGDGSGGRLVAAAA